jgi:hypothetical protein
MGMINKADRISVIGLLRREWTQVNMHVIVLTSLLLMVGCGSMDSGQVDTPGEQSGEKITRSWKVYTRIYTPAVPMRDLNFSYQVEYPSDWSWKENGRTTYFFPPEADDPPQIDESFKGISIFITNFKIIGTLPVYIPYIYTTIRTVQMGDKTILVKKRSRVPNETPPVEMEQYIEAVHDEQYIASIRKGDYFSGFLFSLERKHDDVFDHMLTTFKLEVK